MPKGFMSIISENDIIKFIEPYIGKVVSRVRQGHGSAIFLEVDDLTIMIEWSWRVEKGNEIAFGSWSEESTFKYHLAKLNGLFLSNISFQSRLPEVVIELTDDTWVCSFSTVEGNPEWALITPTNTLLSKSGCLAFE
jgi:hypothetical protein